MSCALRIGKAPVYWSALPSSNWIVTTIGGVAAPRPGGRGWRDASAQRHARRPTAMSGSSAVAPSHRIPAAWRANASGAGRRQVDGRLVGRVRLHVVRRRWPSPLNGANTSTPFAGHACMPLTRPFGRPCSGPPPPPRPGSAASRPASRPGSRPDAACSAGRWCRRRRSARRPQAFAPRMFAEPAVPLGGVGGGAGELVVLARHHREAGAVRGGVVRCPRGIRTRTGRSRPARRRRRAAS